LAEAPDVRSLSFAIKDLEAKLGPIKVKTDKGSDEEVKAHINNITCVVDSKQSTRKGCHEPKAFRKHCSLFPLIIVTQLQIYLFFRSH